ncbi:MAG: hypothetical protein KDE51_19030 [Anaerolineales bacterium]|nr:hypothetical protein [Anaerolineales bacterium]
MAGAGGTIETQNSQFIGNTATGSSGGAISGPIHFMIRISESSFINNTAAQSGGAIVTPMVVTITDSHFENNKANNGPGGAIFTDDELNLTNSTLINNSAAGSGGAINVWGPLNITNSTLKGNVSQKDGGAAFSYAGINIRYALFEENKADSGGAIFANRYETVQILDSTFVKNEADKLGGALYSYANQGAIINTTFSANTANVGGAIANEGHIYLTNSTFYGNTGHTNASSLSVGGYYSLKNVLIAAGNGPICEAGNLPLPVGENNLMDDDSCGPQVGRIGSATQVDPLLADNGGPTPTHALLAGSNAIDSVTDCKVLDSGFDPLPYYSNKSLARDQRGQHRPYDGDYEHHSYCDIGAFEYTGYPLYCNPNSDLSGYLSEDSSTATVTNYGGSQCTYEIGLAAYQKFDENISHQRLYDYTLATIAPGQTLTLGPIELPECAAQIDLFVGQLLPSLETDRYHARLLAARHINGQDYCTTTAAPDGAIQGFILLDGQPYSDVDVALYQNDQLVAETRPLAGFYRLTDLSSGVYQLVVTKTTTNNQLVTLLTTAVDLTTVTNQVLDLTIYEIPTAVTTLAISSHTSTMVTVALLALCLLLATVITLYQHRRDNLG